MGKIYIVGLGPGSIKALTLGAIERIHSGDKNFMRTEEHPTLQYFIDKDIPFKSYDYIYEREGELEKVYEKIADELMREVEENEIINYFVPGNPMVAEKTVEILMNRDIEVEIVSGMSFIEPMIELVERDPIKGLKIVDGEEFSRLMIDINTDMIITQVYNQRILSDIKIIISEVYGDEYNIYIIHNAGIEGKEQVHNIPIYSLDRIGDIGHLTSIYIPKISKKDKKIFDFLDLVGIMEILRGEDGCPWDMEQDHRSIRQNLVEEAYEVVDAIDMGDIDAIVEELGDLLLQVIFHCQIAYDEGNFNLTEVTSALGNKLIYRHPHIFLEKRLENSKEVVYNWNKLKDLQRDFASFTEKLKVLPKFPSLMKSTKLQKKAAEIGFDWKDIQGPMDKVTEEYKEVIEAMKIFGKGHERVEEEIGDLFFAVVNLSRFLEVDPEIALNRTNNKFVERFALMEKEALKLGKNMEDMTLEELDALWNLAKGV